MTPEELIRCLFSMRDRMRKVLAGNADQILEEAAEQVRVSFDQAKKRNRANHKLRPPWGFTISPQRPLEFLESVQKGIRLRVDIFCHLQWSYPAGELSRPRNLVVRIWCLEGSVFFRSPWDSKEISGRVEPNRGRVMLRYHFDFANEGQQGPTYHIQAGGGAHAEEVCWLAEAIDLPRIAHPPIDLLLASEMVAANFFADDYTKIRKDPTWMGSIRIAQDSCYRDYFQSCTKTIGANGNLLASLWNVGL
jgi:hypothetical protein